jgi:hypothetical protein
MREDLASSTISPCKAELCKWCWTKFIRKFLGIYHRQGSFPTSYLFLQESNLGFFESPSISINLFNKEAISSQLGKSLKLQLLLNFLSLYLYVFPEN